MNRSAALINQLHSIRNRYGKRFSTQKLKLLKVISREEPTDKKTIQSWYEILLFLLTYPDNRSVHAAAFASLRQLETTIQQDKKLQDRLFNSGLSHSSLCASFGFEIVKWLRQTNPHLIRLDSFESDDETIRSVISAALPKVESEILQDGNADWRSWLKNFMKKGEDLLDVLISVFDQADIRPEVRDELWAALGMVTEINLPAHPILPASLVKPFNHRSLEKKITSLRLPELNPKKMKLSAAEAETIIEYGRLILVRHFREIDPISFTAAPYVSYYRLSHGISIALMGMIPRRRQPIDCYMGYIAFKNGLPVAYAGSWILFDSGRIGLNIFPAFRGGESQYIFRQIAALHAKVYRLKRLSVDPYQIGKDNSDGIHSGAYWTYYRSGFRSIDKEQKQLAAAEVKKIKTIKNYRTPATVLKKLADSRMELFLDKKAFRFDATDLSRLYAKLIKKQWGGDRKSAEATLFPWLAGLLKIKNPFEENRQFILKNWAVLLGDQKKLSGELKRTLKKLFEAKSIGIEEEYITLLQKNSELRKWVEEMIWPPPAPPKEG